MDNLPLFFFGVLLFLASLFLMALILVQRGKGGGLTGALGGMGGASAFGSKASDAFTKITVITSVIWIGLCMLTIALFNRPPEPPQRVTMSDIEDIYATRSSGSVGSADPGPDAVPVNGGLPGEDALPGEGTNFLETGDEEGPAIGGADEDGPAIGGGDEGGPAIGGDATPEGSMNAEPAPGETEAGSLNTETETPGTATETPGTETPGTETPGTETPVETETPAETEGEGQGQ